MITFLLWLNNSLDILCTKSHTVTVITENGYCKITKYCVAVFRVWRKSYVVTRKMKTQNSIDRSSSSLNSLTQV